MVDKEYCMSSYLMYRTIADGHYRFREDIAPNLATLDFPRRPVHNSEDLLRALQDEIAEATKDGKAALALSAGIDSAILARLMPKGSTAYTFKCVVPGIEVQDETKAAACYAAENGLKHKVVEIYWEDFDKYAAALMLHKGMPFHSIEVQIFKAALQVRKDGFERFIFGENADIIYGGMTGLISKDWRFGEFVDRYSYIMPYQVLKNPRLILDPFCQYEKNGYVDAYAFTNEYFRREALGTYNNACDAAGVKFVGPYANTELRTDLDIGRIRNGDGKYMVREVFHKLYPNHTIPPKVPMPRPTNEWMKNWGGPLRHEFYPHCTDNMNGDQKWMVYILEQYLNYIEQ
jgi:asparagine synthetase B (glutamine-hydrolysing)